MISSIDSVLVRAAASSIASGRPSRERQSSSTASSDPTSVRRRCGGGSAGEQLDGVAQREGSELEHCLAVDVQRDLARAQDPYVGAGVEEAYGEAGGSVHDVLAVVEDHQGVAAPEPFEQGRFAPGTSTAATNVRRHRRRCRGLEPRQPDSVGPDRATQRACGRPRSRPPSSRCHPARRSRRAARGRGRQTMAATSGSRPMSSADRDGRFPGGLPKARPAAADGNRRVTGPGARICCWSCRSAGPGSVPARQPAGS